MLKIHSIHFDDAYYFFYLAYYTYILYCFPKKVQQII